MGSKAASGAPVNCFALVNYVPGELGRFLNALRVELVGGCHAQSHVTLLPPRCLQASAAEAWATVQSVSEFLPPFTVTLDDIQIFHAGTTMVDGKLVVSGGRVLCSTGLGESVRLAQQRAYDGVRAVQFAGAQWRSDIGHRAIKH